MANLKKYEFCVINQEPPLEFEIQDTCHPLATDADLK
jgi:hypothetical protein